MSGREAGQTALQVSSISQLSLKKPVSWSGPGSIHVSLAGAVGETVGEIVGDTLGVCDADGETVDETVGEAEGDTVDDELGVSDTDGEIVGDAVAEGDPLTDAEAVGVKQQLFCSVGVGTPGFPGFPAFAHQFLPDIKAKAVRASDSS